MHCLWHKPRLFEFLGYDNMEQISLNVLGISGNIDLPSWCFSLVLFYLFFHLLRMYHILPLHAKHNTMTGDRDGCGMCIMKVANSRLFQDSYVYIILD